MGKRKPKNTFTEIDYATEATPRDLTPDGIPVFCVHDEIVLVEKAIPNPKNPNQHSTEQVRLLGNIIRANGWRAAVTISKRSGFIVKGHGRRLAAISIGSNYLPVDYQEYASAAEEWADLIADNRLAELATMDTAMLVDLINEMDTGEVPVELTGYTEEDLAAIIAALDGADDTVDDKADAVPAPQNIPMSKPGGHLEPRQPQTDMWQRDRQSDYCQVDERRKGADSEHRPAIRRELQDPERQVRGDKER